MMFSFQIQLSRENFTFSFLTKENQTNKLGSQKKIGPTKTIFHQILKNLKNENLILTRLIVSIFIDYLLVLHILFWQPNKYI